MSTTTHPDFSGNDQSYQSTEIVVVKRINLLTVFLGGFLICGLLLGGLAAVYQMQYAEKIFPGISVAGIDLSGLTVFEATDRIAQQVDFPLDGRIAFQDGTTVWMATPLDLGFFLDAETSARHAFMIGRQGNLLTRMTDQISARLWPIEQPPYFLYNEASTLTYLEGIAAQVDRPVVEASLGLNGIDIDVRSGQVGRKVDINETLQLVGPQLAATSDGLIPLVVNETPPIVLNVEEQAALAREILSEPLQITIANPREGDPGPWTFDPQTLASMLTIERVSDDNGDGYQVALDKEDLRAFLNGIASGLESNPSNPRFIFNDETRELELRRPAVIGRRLLVNQTIREINESLAAG
ncbi:MAG: peptidoglycan binding domain-containing protein, partial [Candidatus Promineifilaceae bacterium]|nr:peptidoglycan binding domain-containing protein [Candidatus Promineifilaceae bacterium]